MEALDDTHLVNGATFREAEDAEVAVEAELAGSSWQGCGRRARASRPGPYTSRALSQLESAVSSAGTHFGSVQPPTRQAVALRDDVLNVLGGFPERDGAAL